MKQYIGKFVVAVAMALAASGVAQAKDNDDEQKACSKATLDGLYVFTASGFNIVGTGAQPKAIVELIDFHGDGTLNNPWTTVSINGNVTQHPHPPLDLPGTGSYSVVADCTGTLLFGTQANPGPAYDLFVAFKGSQIQMIQTGPGSPVFQGTAERVSR
jgi:hypothetical protein